MHVCGLLHIVWLVMVTCSPREMSKVHEYMELWNVTTNYIVDSMHILSSRMLG